MSRRASAQAGGTAKKKRIRDCAYMLFSRAMREDMERKFGGTEAFNAYFAKHYQYEEVGARDGRRC